MKTFILEFIPGEVFPGAICGHLYRPGDTLYLHGLETCPEHNGETVTITAIRQDGPNGRAYYFKGSEALNAKMNWIYEYRLSPTPK